MYFNISQKAEALLVLNLVLYATDAQFIRTVRKHLFHYISFPASQLDFPPCFCKYLICVVMHVMAGYCYVKLSHLLYGSWLSLQMGFCYQVSQCYVYCPASNILFEWLTEPRDLSFSGD